MRLQPSGEIRARAERRAELHRAAREVQAVWLHVHAGDVCPGGLGENGRRQPDGAEADHRHGFARPQRGALHAVCADDQRFDERGLLRRQRRGAMEFVHRHRDQRGMAAVQVDAEHAQVAAAIRLARAARGALSAEVVGFDRAQISRREPAFRRSGNDLHAEFVTQPARIAEKGLLAGERMNVRAAHAASAHPDQRLARGWVRLGNVVPRQRPPVSPAPESSRHEIDFLHVGPDFPLGRGGGQRKLAGVGFLPPALDLGIGGHLLHVGVEVVTGVFEVGEEVELAVDLDLVDREILDVAFLVHLRHARPGVGVQVLVFRRRLGLEAGDPGVAFRLRVRDAGSGQNRERGQDGQERDFHGDAFVLGVVNGKRCRARRR